MSETIEVDDNAPEAAAKDDAAGKVRAGLAQGQGAAVSGRAVTINRPAHELYAFWRDFANLPSFMDNVVSIAAIDHRRSHWVVKAPGGRTVEWDARITQEREGEMIAWTSEEGAEVANSGHITFRPAGARGTVVTATVLYDPPGGTIGKLIAKMFLREPGIQARRDLRRFKQLMETGEIATSARTQAQLHDERN